MIIDENNKLETMNNEHYSSVLCINHVHVERETLPAAINLVSTYHGHVLR